MKEISYYVISAMVFHILVGIFFLVTGVVLPYGITMIVFTAFYLYVRLQLALLLYADRKRNERLHEAIDNFKNNLDNHS